jgi:hypothetical protein
MNSTTQVFFDFFTTLRTLLRSPPRINRGEELSSFPTHILNDSSKLTKCRVKHMFPKHPFSTDSVIQVFHEDHIASVTKSMGLFVVKVLPRVVDLVVKPCNLNALLLVVVRPLLFPRKSTLQHFQPTLQTFKELRRLYEYTVTRQEKGEKFFRGFTRRIWYEWLVFFQYFYEKTLFRVSIDTRIINLNAHLQAET